VQLGVEQKPLLDDHELDLGTHEDLGLQQITVVEQSVRGLQETTLASDQAGDRCSLHPARHNQTLVARARVAEFETERAHRTRPPAIAFIEVLLRLHGAVRGHRAGA